MEYDRPLFNIGDIVQHFKHVDTINNPLNYIYKIIGIALNTDNDTYCVVYQALYGDEQLFTRSIDDFYSKVDLVKYPQAKQIYKFEKIQ